MICDTLGWEELRRPLDEKSINAVEHYFGVVLPLGYRQCLIKYHGAYPAVSEFSFVASDGRRINSCLGALLTADCDEPEIILNTYEGMGHYKDKKVIPIGDDGGGDLICLDYRGDSSIPKVCYFQHELGELENIAVNFEDFCKMLKRPAI